MSERSSPTPDEDGKRKAKRPYRRTKRPKNYNDKSTITTTTENFTSLNVYDAVLSESEDLLQAATEAQQLGRLKMASAYLLLLHARLVGLGKRFDKAEHPEPELNNANAANKALPSLDRKETPQKPFAIEQETPKTAAAKQLAQMLPSNIEMDQAMMEHLAKAAAELHAARCGRKRPDITSPTAREFLENTANRQNIHNAAHSGVAWTENDISLLNQAVENGKEPKEIAGLLQKSEPQVKAYLRNQHQMAKVEADLELNETPKKRGGRGRKPATTAMTTVPSAVCSARDLLQGKLLDEEQTE